MTRRYEIEPGWAAALASSGLRDVGELLERRLGDGGVPGEWRELSKPGLGGRQRWRWSPPGEGAARCVYLKVYERTPLRAQLDRMVRQSARHSRAWWEFRQSHVLTLASIPVARAVAFAEQMHGALEHRSVVVLEGMDGEPLDAAWRRACAEGAPMTRGPGRFELVRGLARFVAAFHGTGCCHRDLYLCHVFITTDERRSTARRFGLIDLARTHTPRWRRTRWLVKDLAQLDCSARQVGATRSDRWRFLMAYLGLERGAARLRWYARRIVRKSDRILRRISRSSGGR